MALKYKLFACVRVAPSLRTRCPILGKSQNPCFYFLSLKLEYIDFFSIRMHIQFVYAHIDANWQNDRRIRQGTTPNSLKMRTRCPSRRYLLLLLFL